LDLLQHVLVRDAVDERHHDVQARPQRGVVFAEPLDHPGMLLRHDVDGLEYEHQRNDEHDQRDGAKTEFHSLLLMI
jgi:hypothetical protein